MRREEAMKEGSEDKSQQAFFRLHSQALYLLLHIIIGPNPAERW